MANLVKCPPSSWRQFHIPPSTKDWHKYVCYTITVSQFPSNIIESLFLYFLMLYKLSGFPFLQCFWSMSAYFIESTKKHHHFNFMTVSLGFYFFERGKKIIKIQIFTWNGFPLWFHLHRVQVKKKTNMTIITKVFIFMTSHTPYCDTQEWKYFNVDKC